MMTRNGSPVTSARNDPQAHCASRLAAACSVIGCPPAPARFSNYSKSRDEIYPDPEGPAGLGDLGLEGLALSP
jgi:hypothetical protein